MSQPRRIVPGQRVHASVWCEDAYRPHATLGGGIEIPIIIDNAPDLTTLSQPLEPGHSDGTIPAERMMELAWVRRYAAHELEVLLKLS